MFSTFTMCHCAVGDCCHPLSSTLFAPCFTRTATIDKPKKVRIPCCHLPPKSSWHISGSGFVEGSYQIKTKVKSMMFADPELNQGWIIKINTRHSFSPRPQQSHHVYTTCYHSSTRTLSPINQADGGYNRRHQRDPSSSLNFCKEGKGWLPHAHELWPSLSGCQVCTFSALGDAEINQCFPH